MEPETPFPPFPAAPTPAELAYFERMIQVQQAFVRQHKPGPHTVIAIVAEVYDVTPADILNHTRGHPVNWARTVAMAMCCEFFQQDSKKIGEVFRRHHSRIRSARKQLLFHQRTPEGRAEMDAIRVRIRSALES